MSKTRACYNCLHYEQVPWGEEMPNWSPLYDKRPPVRGFSPRCAKALNPALENAPDNMETRRAGKFEPDEMAGFCDSYLWAPLAFNKLRSWSKRKLTKEPRFTTVGLSEKFLPWFERGQEHRIKIERGVMHKYSEFGYVSISTGWQPALLLIRSASSRGSSVLLEDDDRIVGYKRATEKRYMPVIE